MNDSVAPVRWFLKSQRAVVDSGFPYSTAIVKLQTQHQNPATQSKLLKPNLEKRFDEAQEGFGATGWEEGKLGLSHGPGGKWRGVGFLRTSPVWRQRWGRVQKP